MALPAVRFGVFLVALLAAFSLSIHAQSFKASAVEGAASITDGLAQVSFKVAVTNDARSAMTNVFVIFADGTELSVGDVAPQATVTTEQQSRTIDVAESGSRTVVMNVTLKYAIDGENVEVPWILSVLAE